VRQRREATWDLKTITQDENERDEEKRRDNARMHKTVGSDFVRSLNTARWACWLSVRFAAVRVASLRLLSVPVVVLLTRYPTLYILLAWNSLLPRTL
jgi:hypothetical protein